MTARTFALPDLGEGLTDAELVRWLVAVGEEIAVDQPLAEVETAKSVVEVPSPYAGVVAALHGEEGETIAVGAPLVEVEETVPAASGSGSGQVLVGYGTSEQAAVRRRRVAGVSSVSGVSVASGTAARPVASVSLASGRVVPVDAPVVRALARSHGVDLAALRPTGVGGVVTRRDVEAALAAPAASAPPAAAPVPSPAAPARDPRTGLAVRSSEPFSRFRRTVAETMSRSRSEIPEATVWVDVDATELWEGRRRLRLDGRTPSLLAFVARFALAALARHPELAGRVTPDGAGLETFDGVNLGFAADTPRGLLVPVVRRADRLTVRELDAELDRLTRAARDGGLAPADLTGSTFTVNNYGSLGVDGSAAIINHPEVALLGIGRALERPWVRDGAIVSRRILQLSLVFDHRITDGGVAAAFLREIADAIESPLAVLADAPPA